MLLLLEQQIHLTLTSGQKLSVERIILRNDDILCHSSLGLVFGGRSYWSHKTSKLEELYADVSALEMPWSMVRILHTISIQMQSALFFSSFLLGLQVAAVEIDARLKELYL
jgi:hypothetical protein